MFPEKKQTPYNHRKPHILFWSIKTVAQNEERGKAFDDRRDTVPHSVHVKKITRPEALNQEVEYTKITSHTACQVDWLIGLRIPGSVQISEDLDSGQEDDVLGAHVF